MPVTSRNMKILGVICAIIALGTLSTLGLQLYMNRLFASKGYSTADEVAIINEEDTSHDGQVALKEESHSLMSMETALAGMARIQESCRKQEEERRQIQAVSVETAAGKEETEDATVTLIRDHFSYESEEELNAALVESPEIYMEYLGDVEIQVDSLYKVMEETTIQERLNIQNYAYRIWDDELNRIYPLVRRRLTESESEALKYEELGWIRERDAKAQKASETANSENMKQLVYTRSLTDTTRERTYFFVDMYFGLAQ